MLVAHCRYRLGPRKVILAHRKGQHPRPGLPSITHIGQEHIKAAEPQAGRREVHPDAAKSAERTGHGPLSRCALSFGREDVVGQKWGNLYANQCHLMPNGAISYSVGKALQPLLFGAVGLFCVNTPAQSAFEFFLSPDYGGMGRS